MRAVSDDTYVVLDDDKCAGKIWAALRDHRGSTSTLLKPKAMELNFHR